MDRLQYYRLETGRYLNICVCVGICLDEGSLLAICRAFHAAIVALAVDGCASFIDELATLPLGSAASKKSVTAASFDEGSVEAVCKEYLIQLRLRRLCADDKFDPAHIADLLLDRIVCQEPWQGDSTLYAYNLAIVRRYKLNGWHLLVPLIIAFDLGLPELASLLELEGLLKKVAESTSRISVKRLFDLAELNEYAGCKLLIESRINNRSDVAFSSEACDEVYSTRVVGHCLELLARYGRDQEWFRVSGTVVALDAAPSVTFDFAPISKFFAYHRVGLRNRFSCEQMLTKALVRRRVPEQLEQGLSICLQGAIVDLLLERQEVVSVAQVRQFCGLQTLNINPFAVLPGRVLVYAPSPRFLHSSSVVFVLREWVQDSVHRKGRIAPVRVLTPLKPVTWEFSRADLMIMIRSSRSFELFGVESWPKLRRSLVAAIPLQARRWAIHHLDRQSLNVFRVGTIYRVGNMVLDEASWGDLRHVPSAHAVVTSTVANAHDVALPDREAVIALLKERSN